jgi:subfamily B ATP-binding cassette protein MsbA
LSSPQRPEFPAIERMTTVEKLRILRRLIAFGAPYRRHLAVLLLVTGIEVILSKAEPFIAQFIVDDVLVQRDASLLNWVFLVMIGLFILRSSYSWLVQYIAFFLHTRVTFDVRKRFFTHLQQQSRRFYEENPAAEIVHAESTNLPQMQRFLIGSLDELSNQSAHLLAGMALMLLVNWKLALLCFGTLPLWVACTLYFSRRLAPVTQQMNELDMRLKRRLGQSVAGVEVIQGFNRQDFERRRYFGDLWQAALLGVDQLVWGTATRTTLNAVWVLGMALVFWFGGHQIIRGEMTIGQLIAFNMLLSGLFGPVTVLLGYFRQMNSVVVAALRVFGYWDLKPEVQSDAGALALRNVQGSLEFAAVDFGYDGREAALHGVSFEVLPGQMVAFCGPSGSGKSTIGRLLMRFYDPSAGDVFVDGFNLKELELGTYRQSVGLVSQEPFMFEDTVAENIRYGRPDATLDDVRRAARLAQAEEFIHQLPQGYDTPLRAGGGGLSTGQVQRLAIARALLADPRILILDEATSALDTETERVLQDALEVLFAGRTSVVIAHRLSTIVHADRIYVLDEGRVVEEGTHDELLARGGQYFTLWQRQLGEEAGVGKSAGEWAGEVDRRLRGAAGER